MIRLYVDEDAMSGAVVHALRSRGMDVLTSYEAETLEMTDDQQLQFSTDIGRVFYTLNVNDFPRIHKQWTLDGRSHGGIIVGTQQRLAIGDQLRRFIRLVASVQPAEWRNRLEYLNNW